MNDKAIENWNNFGLRQLRGLDLGALGVLKRS